MDFLSPSLYSAIAGLIAIILFSHYLLKRSRVGLAKTVPIAPGAWPVIGHLPLLGGTQPPHLTLGAMADKLGHGQRVLHHQQLGRDIATQFSSRKTHGL